MGLPPSPRYLTTVRELRKAIEAHPGIPPEYSNERMEIYRLLSGLMSAWKVSTYSRSWRALRKRILSAGRDEGANLFCFFEDVYTTICFQDLDDDFRVNRERAHEAGPSRRWIDRLVQKGGPAVATLRAAVPPERLPEFDQIRIAAFQFTNPRGGLREWWIQLGDLMPPTKMKPGGGRGVDSYMAREVLVGRLVRSFGLTARAAAGIAKDVFLWFLGQRLESETVRKWWKKTPSRRRPSPRPS